MIIPHCVGLIETHVSIFRFAAASMTSMYSSTAARTADRPSTCSPRRFRIAPMWRSFASSARPRVSLILSVFREAFLAQFLAIFELAVAAMLIAIGLVSLTWEFRVLQRLGLLHEHPHEHLTGAHAHPHFHVRRFGDHGTMFGIGVVHGLASNDELLIPLAGALSFATCGGLLLGVAVFSVGVVLGMVLFGIGLSYPIVRWGDAKVRRGKTGVTPVPSHASRL